MCPGASIAGVSAIGKGLPTDPGPSPIKAHCPRDRVSNSIQSVQVAVVGLGKMGATLARRLLSEGLAVTVWNRNPAAAGPLANDGAQAVTELPEIWSSAGTALTFLADDEAVLQVYLSANGLVDSAPDGALLIEMSTISPAASLRVAVGRQRSRVALPPLPRKRQPGGPRRRQHHVDRLR